jgi:hypothetical protein
MLGCHGNLPAFFPAPPFVMIAAVRRVEERGSTLAAILNLPKIVRLVLR